MLNVLAEFVDVTKNSFNGTYTISYKPNLGYIYGHNTANDLKPNVI